MTKKLHLLRLELAVVLMGRRLRRPAARHLRKDLRVEVEGVLSLSLT